MNINVTFHIVVKAWGTQTTYRMLVEHFYSSDQVERFRIRSKTAREIVLEKRVAVNKQPWKLVCGEINTTDIKTSAMAMRDSQDAIDYYLIARKTNPINEGYFSLEEIKHELKKNGKSF